MSNSQVILPTTTYTGSGDPVEVRGEKYRGDGYYSRSDGLHTVQIRLTDFVGVIEIEGTLDEDPNDPFYTKCYDGTDWSPVMIEEPHCVSTTGLWGSSIVPFRLSYTVPNTTINMYNFTGNYTWLRVFVSEWTAGTINGIKMNH